MRTEIVQPFLRIILPYPGEDRRRRVWLPNCQTHGGIERIPAWYIDQRLLVRENNIITA
jgi:hypothetical protein